MKPITLISTLRRLEAIEGEAHSRYHRHQDESANQSKRDQILGLVIDASLSNEEVVQQIQSLGGRQSVACVARIRQLLDLARQRKGEGWTPA